MVESNADRSARREVNPFTGDPIASPTSAAGASPINGHDWNPGADLEFACTFAVKTPRDCAAATGDCDCKPAEDDNATHDWFENPACQDPSSGSYGATQYLAKAYPGIRELQVLKGLGSQGIVASICAANLADPSATTYGYRPAIQAIVDRLRVPLRSTCLPARIQADLCGPTDAATSTAGTTAAPTTGAATTGAATSDAASYAKVPCVILEARLVAGACACDGASGRAPVGPDDAAAVTPEVVAAGNCICELKQLTGAEARACQNEIKVTTDISGWCYVDPQVGGNPALICSCPYSRQQTIRYLNAGQPKPNAQTFVVCREQAFGATGPDGGACSNP
jgi:hypothetical protein